MYDENNNGLQNQGSAPVLDDFDYTAPTAKREGPQGVAAPILDDMDFVAPTPRRDGPQGVAAPVLDDMDSFTPKKPEKLVLSDEEVIAGLTPELKAQFELLTDDQKKQVIDMRRSQLGAEAPQPAVTAAILDDDNYTPPVKKEPEHPTAPVQAAILDDEPELPKQQTSSYEQQELERIKQEAAKKAVSSQLVSEQKDQKESLRKMLALKEDLRKEQAKKGFKISIVLAAIGFIGSIAFYLLYSGKLGLDYKNGLEGAAKLLENSTIYVTLAMALSAIGVTSGIGGLKSLASFIYLVSGVIQIFPGLAMIPQHEGSLALVGILYAVSFGCTVGVFVTLSASECLGQYFSKRNQI